MKFRKNELKRDLYIAIGILFIVFAIGFGFAFGNTFSVANTPQRPDDFWMGFTMMIRSLLLASALGITITIVGVRIASAWASNIK